MEYRFETECYSLERTLLCGQCFRFAAQPDGSFRGFARGVALQLWQRGDTVFVKTPTPLPDSGWLADYFGFSQDGGAERALAADPTLREMLRFSSGIRIMNQPFFEVLCCFILSQNNNIPRITAIVSRLCEQFGQPREGCFDFPTPERLASLTVQDLAVLRCGYRAPYLLDAAQKLHSGEVTEQAVRQLPTEQARQLLLRIRGVGPKVADCVLLFGAGHTDAFPQDVWMKRAMARYFPAGLPACALPYAGLAQQVIFHFARTEGVFD